MCEVCVKKLVTCICEVRCEIGCGESRRRTLKGGDLGVGGRKKAKFPLADHVRIWYNYFRFGMNMPACRNGRRGRLKICCGQPRAGSSPAAGSAKPLSLSGVFLFGFLESCAGNRR